MFDPSFPELFIVSVIALIVLGPQRLPRVARTLGFWISKLRTQTQALRAEITAELNDSDLQEAYYEQEQALHNAKVLIEHAKLPDSTSKQGVSSKDRLHNDD